MKAGEIWIQYLLSLVPDGEWQHITFTLPCEFWTLIYHNRWLLAEMSRLAADVVLESGRRAGLLPGCFAVIHTWGSDQQWHPHIHLSTAAGGVTDDNGWKKLQFYGKNVMAMWRWRIPATAESRPAEMYPVRESDVFWRAETGFAVAGFAGLP